MDGEFNLKIKSSKLELCFLVALVLLTLVSVCLSGLSLWLKAVLCLAFVCFGARQFFTNHILNVSEISYLNGRWFITQLDKQIEVQWCGEQFISPGLIVLQYIDLEGRNKGSVVLWKDSAELNDLRRLRVAIKYSVFD